MYFIMYLLCIHYGFRININCLKISQYRNRSNDDLDLTFVVRTLGHQKLYSVNMTTKISI